MGSTEGKKRRKQGTLREFVMLEALSLSSIFIFRLDVYGSAMNYLEKGTKHCSCVRLKLCIEFSRECKFHFARIS